MRKTDNIVLLTGWEASLVHYFKEIRSLFGQSFASLHCVVPRNRYDVHGFVERAWNETMIMCMGIHQKSSISLSQEHFTGYINEELQSLERSLDEIRYRIDNTDTVRMLIEGPLERVSGPQHFRLYHGTDNS